MVENYTKDIKKAFITVQWLVLLQLDTRCLERL